MHFRKLHMKKLFLLLVALSIVASGPAGCTPRYGKYQPASKEALRAIAGGLLGALAAGNTGGAIVGAFVADIYSVSAVKYEDKKLEDTDEASRKRNNGIKEVEQKREREQKAEDLIEEDKKAEKERPEDKKAEKERPEDKKAEKERPEDQKAEKERPEDKKAEKERPEDKKAEKERPEDKKAEKERPEDRKAKKKYEEMAKFAIEDFLVSKQTAKTGSHMEAKVQYTVQTTNENQEIKLTETRIFFTPDKKFELDRRDIYRTEGRYISVIKFRVPEDLPKGYCILYTTLSDGKRSKTEKTVINII